MRDEMDARIWNEHGARFSKDVGRALAKLKHVFDRIHAVEFRAPWRGPAPGQG